MSLCFETYVGAAQDATAELSGGDECYDAYFESVRDADETLEAAIEGCNGNTTCEREAVDIHAAACAYACSVYLACIGQAQPDEQMVTHKDAIITAKAAYYTCAGV